MLFASKQITSQEFIRPAENLVRHIAKENENEPLPVPDVPHAWRPWFSEISRIFAENRRMIQEIKEKNDILTEMNIGLERYMPKFLLVVNTKKGVGGTTIGNFFANALAAINKDKKTVYMEYPAPEKISDNIDVDVTQKKYNHPNGYDILLSYDAEIESAPYDIKTSLLISKVLEKYNNIVINVNLESSDHNGEKIDFESLLKYAKAVIFLVQDDDDQKEDTQKIINEIKKNIRRDKTRSYVLANKTKGSSGEASFQYDFDVPFIDKSMESFAINKIFSIPIKIRSVIDQIVDRVERVHQLAVFIPTTINVDQKIDTTLYVTKAIDFFSKKFGGATSTQAEGGWNSNELGVVTEVLHVVVTYTTENDLNRYMDEVIRFVKDIKKELHQEAMAMEINNKMILI
ncbi:MAG: hypothetical protein D3906_07630 [Candidatus Electrothrix sp. AUS1_2]|nr:hypothetical protein [Candidatus Electrothrix sp. AUS1_2]